MAPSQHSSLDLGVVGNSAAAALIDEQARLVWMCVPRFDGDPVFCRLLGGDAADGGDFAIVLPQLAETRQFYRRNTAILETFLTDAAGNQIKITDFAPRFWSSGRMYRPLMIIRLIEPVAGTPRISIRIQPRYDYGAREPEVTRGSNHLTFALGANVLRLTTDIPISYVQSATPFTLDRPVALFFGPDQTLTDAPLPLATQFLAETNAYWIDWSRYLSLSFEWQDVVIRAAITLKLCSHEETGGIVAALTTSIPEYGSTGRTWDYRFCWLRDSYFTVRALNRLGTTMTMEGYIRYVAEIVASSSDGYLQPLYGLGLERAIDERTVSTLAGYRGLGPVRAGNAAYTQVQNDGYGSVILAIAQAFFDERLPIMGDETLFRRLEPLGEQANWRWKEPDAGLWEFRSKSNPHTYSGMMCWAAVDRLARIADRLGLTDRALYWRRSAEVIRTGVLSNAWNEERGYFASSFAGRDLDASLLLMPDIGFLPASDPRYVATLAAAERELRVGGHLYRYRVPDDFGEPDTAFTACSFWLVDALARVGRTEEARDTFCEILSRRNRLGLLSEGLRVETGELWGNFPQTYSMVGLINSAMRLSRSWEDAF